MNTLTLSIFISGLIVLVVFLLIKLYRNYFANKNSKLPFSERIFLESNMESELNNEEISDQFLRADNTEKKKDFKEATKDIDVILEQDKENLGVVLKSGLDKLKVRKYKDSIEDFSQVLDNNPSNRHAFYYRGLANLKLSNFTKALNDLTSAITIGIKAKEAYFYRGLAEIEIQKYVEAIEDFNLYLGTNPTSLEAYLNRGIAHAKCANFEFALKDFNKTIELNPNNDKAYFERAMVKKELNDLMGYSNDLKTAYNKGYLHAYHFLKDT